MMYYFYGDNSYAASRAIAQVREQYAKKADSILDVQSFDMAEASLADVIAAINVVAMFATVRMIIVRDLASNKTAVTEAAKLASLVPEETVLVIYDRNVDRRSSYFKTMAASEYAEEFVPLDPVKMRAWIASQVKSLAGTINGLTAQKLYEAVAHEYKPRDRDQMRLCGQDQWQLEQEIRKLISYDPNITIDTVDLLVSPNIEQTIFELTDAVTNGKSDEAQKMYANLTTRGVSDQQIIAMLNWQMRIIVLARENMAKDSGWQREFGLSPFVVTKAMRLGDSYDHEAMVRAYRLLFETDLAIKTGAKESGLALTTLLYELSYH